MNKVRVFYLQVLNICYCFNKEIKIMAKINILVVPSDNMGGVGFYRSTQPHIQLEKQFPDDFSVTFEMAPNFQDLHSFDKYDLIHVHKGLFGDMVSFRNALAYFKEKGIVTVMDIDDHWKLNRHHPLFTQQAREKTDKTVCDNLRLFDYVTTTTPIFADEIKPYNKNVFVFPNSIDPTDPRFAVNKKDSKLIRVGMIMGSSHEYDMMLLNNISNKLPSNVMDKIQFVLCGYDLRGTITEYNMKTGESKTRNIMPKETVWYRYEKMLTDNYRWISEDYKNFLEMFIPNSHYPTEDYEHYKRCWTKDMNHYYEHYSQCDILLAPIEISDFNKVKSQLKVIECAFSHTAIVASDFGPYTIDLKPINKKGGEIDLVEGNAFLVDESKNHKDWAKSVEKLVNNPEILKAAQDNLARDICQKYDLRNVTVERANFYKRIVNDKKNEN